MWQIRDVLVPMMMLALIVFLGLFAIHNWPEQWGGEGDAPGPQFELFDCIPSSSLGHPTTVTGAGELVEIGGVEYVRFNSLGEVSIQGAVYTVGPARLDLVLLTGQSNSVYYTNPTYYDGESPVAPGKAFYLGSAEPESDTLAGLAVQSDVWESGITDMVAPDGSVNVSQMYPDFCSAYVKETKHRVLVVNSGIGGRGIAEWDVNGRCDLWTEIVLDRVSQIEAGGTVAITPAAVLWSQGESDASRSEEYYLEHLEGVVDRMTGDRYAYSFPRMVSVLPRDPHSDVIAPAMAQEAFASESDRFSIASTLPQLFDPAVQCRDGIHYTQTAYGWLGEAFGRKAGIEMGFSPVSETIVLCADVGTVAELPSVIVAYGTSGAEYELVVNWAETDTEGVYSANFLGSPIGTRLDPGLSATAELEEPTEVGT